MAKFTHSLNETLIHNVMPGGWLHCNW